MSSKVYDLEERTFQFAKDTRVFVKDLPKTISNYEDVKQVVRSSGSVGANYIEANEKLSEKDFDYRIKICRKEAKETIYGLRLIKDTNDSMNRETIVKLINEADELKKIFSAILIKRKNNEKFNN